MDYGDIYQEDYKSRIWRDMQVVVAYFKALSKHLRGGTEENNENTQISLLAKV
jgi:hypothetical protein